MHYYRELHFFSRKALRGRYRAAWAAAMLALTVSVGAWLFPAILSAVLIRRGTLLPEALFTSTRWLLLAALWQAAAFCIRMPVQCGVRSWFSALTELEVPGQERCFFRTARAFFRGLYFFGMTGLLRFLAAAPFATACVLTAFFLRQSIGLEEGAGWLFAAVQGLAAMFWAACFYVRFCVSLAAVPYLFLEDPRRGVFRTVRLSCRLMNGYHGRFWGVVLPYLPAALPGVTVPFLLPHLMTDLTLFLQLRIREYAQLRPKGAFHA